MPVPADPAYLRFKSGIVKTRDDIADRFRWRWSPKDTKWYTYSIADWILEDVQVADTPMSSMVNLRREQWLDNSLPGVFEAVGRAYDRTRLSWPNLVWTHLGGGDWRNPTSRVPGVPDRPPEKPAQKPAPIPQECLDRMKAARKLAEDGYITSAQAQQIIRQIAEECSGVELP